MLDHYRVSQKRIILTRLILFCFYLLGSLSGGSDDSGYRRYRPGLECCLGSYTRGVRRKSPELRIDCNVKYEPSRPIGRGTTYFDWDNRLNHFRRCIIHDGTSRLNSINGGLFILACLGIAKIFCKKTNVINRLRYIKKSTLDISVQLCYKVGTLVWVRSYLYLSNGSHLIRHKTSHAGCTTWTQISGFVARYCFYKRFSTLDTPIFTFEPELAWLQHREIALKKGNPCGSTLNCYPRHAYFADEFQSDHIFKA
jgi:hypothetical protein